MAINLSTTVYAPNFNVWSRPITVTPVASQPNAAPYGARGIFDTKETDVVAQNGSVYSDAKTILDIRQVEFAVLPMQKDIIFIPPHMDEPGGTFEVFDTTPGNAGGEITLTLKRVVTPKPA